MAKATNKPKHFDEQTFVGTMTNNIFLYRMIFFNIDQHTLFGMPRSTYSKTIGNGNAK